MGLNNKHAMIFNFCSFWKPSEPKQMIKGGGEQIKFLTFGTSLKKLNHPRMKIPYKWLGPCSTRLQFLQFHNLLSFLLLFIQLLSYSLVSFTKWDAICTFLTRWSFYNSQFYLLTNESFLIRCETKRSISDRNRNSNKIAYCIYLSYFHSNKVGT